MNKQEFYAYIDEFDCCPGEYTQDEIYEIGLKHKELERSERNWTELSNYLGLEKTGEALRCWIKARQLEENTLPKNPQMLSSRTIDEAGVDELEDNLLEQKKDLQKQEVRTRDAYRAYRETLRTDARNGRFFETLKDSIGQLKKFKPVDFKMYTPEDDTEAVLLFSDLHLGVEINNFYNHYNLEIAKKRVSKLAADVADYCKMFKIKKLHILNLGDCIRGLIHVNGRIQQEMDVISQITNASEIIAQFLNQLSISVPKLVYRSCTDNHARAVADMKQNVEAENFGKIIDFYLSARLAGTKVEFVNDNLDVDLGVFELTNGKLIGFTHGHRDNYAVAFQNFVGATRKYIDYICMGHYHNSKVKSFQGAKVFVNGSIVGSEQYAQSKRLYGNPEQTLLIFKGDNISVNYINLNIQD